MYTIAEGVVRYTTAANCGGGGVSASNPTLINPRIDDTLEVFDSDSNVATRSTTHCTLRAISASNAVYANVYTRGASNARAVTHIHLDAASLSLSNSSFIAFRDAASNAPHYVLGVTSNDVLLSSPAGGGAMYINSGNVTARTDIGYANSNAINLYHGTRRTLSSTDTGNVDVTGASSIALDANEITLNDRITVDRTRTLFKGNVITTEANTIQLGAASMIAMGASNVVVDSGNMELKAASLKLMGNQSITLQSPAVRLTKDTSIQFDDINSDPHYVLGVSSGDNNVRLINTALGSAMYVNPDPSASELQINYNNPNSNGTTFYAHSNTICRINNDGLEVFRGQIKLPENSIPYKSLKGDGDKLMFGHRFGEQGFVPGVGGAYMLNKKWTYMAQVNDRSRYTFVDNDFRDDRTSQLSNISCCVHVHVTNYGGNVGKVGYMRFVMLTPSDLMSEKVLVVETKIQKNMDGGKFGAFIDYSQPGRPIYVTCDPFCYVSFTVLAGY